MDSEEGWRYGMLREKWKRKGESNVRGKGRRECMGGNEKASDDRMRGNVRIERGKKE